MSFPLFLLKGSGIVKEELRLIRIGYPLSEAVGIVFQKRKDGDLEKFILEQEKEYHRQCEKIAKEVIG